MTKHSKSHEFEPTAAVHHCGRKHAVKKIDSMTQREIEDELPTWWHLDEVRSQIHEAEMTVECAQLAIRSLLARYVADSEERDCALEPLETVFNSVTNRLFDTKAKVDYVIARLSTSDQSPTR
jgi:hypothetical protein